MFHKCKIATVAVLGALSVAKGFVVHRRTPTTKLSVRQLTTDNAGDSNEERRKRLFESEGWPQIKKDMNTVPVFCCANGEGQPLKYQVNEYELAFFYCHVPDAKRELTKAREETSIPGLDIVPYPLGEVFEMVSDNQAIIIPSAEDLSAAGCPAEVSPVGQQIPLFACMEIMQELEDGTAVLPLFFKLDEAKAALGMALQTDGGDVNEFEITGLSLEKAVEALATVPETPAFQFITPAASIEHIEGYLKE